MAMGPEFTAAVALSAVNVVLLLGLIVVWLRNYRTFRSTLALGLVAFAVAMLVENVVALYFSVSMASLYGDGAVVGRTVLLLRALQFLALAFLTYVTMQ